MTKRPKLSAGVKPKAPPPPPAMVAAARALAADTKRRPEKGPLKYERPPSRQGKRTLSAHVAQEVHFQVEQIRLKRVLAAGQRVTTQDVLEEALNLLFDKYGMSRIAG